MSVAICDQEAFYPLRNLVAGPLINARDLAEAERFVRTVVMHDEIEMELEPWRYDPDSDREFTEEEKRRGKRNVIVAVGPTTSEYGFFTERFGPRETVDIPLSASLLGVAQQFSNAAPGNVYYDAHVEYLQRIVSIVEAGGSALLAGEFGRTALETSAVYPSALFDRLDQDWQEFARDADRGDIGLVIPPLLSVVLTRSATRAAIPTVIEDLRAEFAAPRSKVWNLLTSLKRARSTGEVHNIRKELHAASQMMSPTSEAIESRSVRVLWDLIAGSAAGAATALLSGGQLGIGAVTGALANASQSLPPLVSEIGPALFSRGAFDLARRVRRATSQADRKSLERLLTRAETDKLLSG